MEKTKLGPGIKKLTVTAMLVALNIVLVRYLGITTDIVKINFGFLPLTAAAILYGPLWGGCTFAFADIAGMLLNGGGKTYFFPFTVSEFLYGVIYGLVLHGRKRTLPNIALAVVSSTLLLNLGLTPLWNMLYMKIFMGKTLSYAAIWLTKLIPALVLMPVRIITIYMLWRYCGAYMEKYSK